MARRLPDQQNRNKFIAHNHPPLRYAASNFPANRFRSVGTVQIRESGREIATLTLESVEC